MIPPHSARMRETLLIEIDLISLKEKGLTLKEFDVILKYKNATSLAYIVDLQ